MPFLQIGIPIFTGILFDTGMHLNFKVTFSIFSLQIFPDISFEISIEHCLLPLHTPEIIAFVVAEQHSARRG